jgi:hypothetical protein
MCGSAVGDALMQMAHELENVLRASEVLCREKAALEERVTTLEKENVRLKLCYLKNQIYVVEAV